MGRAWWMSAVLVSIALGACGDDDERGGGAAVGGIAGNAGSGGFSGTAGGGSGAGGAAGCPSATATAARVTPTVTLVVDGSRSMEDDYGDDNDSRWSALTSALIDPQMGVVPQLDAAIEFGLAVFSTGDGSPAMCPFPLPRIAPILNNADAITNTLDRNNPPGTYTPTGPALAAVVESLPNSQQVLDQDLGPQIIVLATDGEPNSCSDTERDFDSAIAAAEAARAKGIDMYVISLAEADGEFANHLQEMANIGAGLDRAANPGAHLYVPTNPAALSADLQSILGGAVGCDIVLNGAVSAGFECSGNATLNSEPLVCGDANGWMLVDPSHVRLLGSACDRFKADLTVQFHVAFPCNGFMPD